MSKRVRAKFYVNSVVEEVGMETVRLSAVYGTDDKDNEENNQFADATPWGELTMGVSNPDAKGFIKQGEEYYLDFIKVD